MNAQHIHDRLLNIVRAMPSRPEMAQAALENLLREVAEECAAEDAHHDAIEDRPINLEHAA